MAAYPSHQITASKSFLTLGPRVVPLLHHDEGDSGLVTIFQGLAGALDGAHLAEHDLLELTLAHAVAVVQDLLRLATPVVTIEVFEQNRTY
jgi:hypothetical protein